MKPEDMASLAYDGICNRAMKMIDEEFPNAGNARRLWMEAGVAAGVTAAITTLLETGLLKTNVSNDD